MDTESDLQGSKRKQDDRDDDVKENQPSKKSKNTIAQKIPEATTVVEIGTPSRVTYDHLTFDFLKNHLIMDANRRKPTHPDYDPSTLYVPSDFMAKLSPDMSLWWSIKANGMNDKILFIKVGEFYALYHMDAVIAANELGISFVRSKYAQCGFPKKALEEMSDKLVKKGYKIEVIIRELFQVVTPGAFGFRNSSTRTWMRSDLGAAIGGAVKRFDDDVEERIYSIKESKIDDAPRNKSRLVVDIGVAVINTNRRKIMIAQFADDNQRSKLRTMLSRFTPYKIIYEKNNLSKDTELLLNTTLPAVRKEELVKNEQFLSADEALKRLHEGGYFDNTPTNLLSRCGLPVGLTEALIDADNRGLTVAPNYLLAVNSLGGLIYSLHKSHKDLRTLANFAIYHPTDEHKSEQKCLTTNSQPFYTYQHNMIIDSNALHNLDLLKNSTTGGIEGTLLETLDYTSTPFGKRLLLQYIATPLCHPHHIIERQDAISELIKHEAIVYFVRWKLKNLPDLEKLIDSILSTVLSTPVSQNLIFDRQLFKDLIAAICALQEIISIQSNFRDINFEHGLQSKLLIRLSLCERDDITGLFPYLSETMNFFEKAFDNDQVKRYGLIIPKKEFDADFDKWDATIKKIDGDLDKYLEEQATLLGCEVTYFGTNANRYKLEIPESKCGNVPSTYTLYSQRKGFKSYETEETKRLLHEMMEAEGRREISLKPIYDRIFAEFNKHHLLWSATIDCLSQLDVLMSLASFSRGVDRGSMVRPEIKEIEGNDKPLLLITDGRYPCKTQTWQFISNTIKLGSSTSTTDDNRVMIVTGPNMGVKSTLMRQTALIIILSQLGCYVPAKGPVILTPIDRFLTRQGANDAIGSGQSTLQVELDDTANILTHMIAHSFLLVDELCRGSATQDFGAPE